MTTTQIMQAINAVSQRVNDLSQRMDAHLIVKLCDYFKCEIGELLVLIEQ